MTREGFTLLELLVVMSIILVLLSICLPCLLRAKDSALQLVAMEVEVNEEGKVSLEINDRSNRKPTDDIYMIKIDRPAKSHVRLKKPLPSGMKLEEEKTATITSCGDPGRTILACTRSPLFLTAKKPLKKRSRFMCTTRSSWKPSARTERTDLPLDRDSAQVASPQRPFGKLRAGSVLRPTIRA